MTEGADPWAEIAELARTRQAEAQAAKQAADTDARFDKLEGQLGTLAEGMQKLVESSARSESPATDTGEGDAAPVGGESGGASPEISGPPPEEELPVELVERETVPRIYTGDDEPAEVAYIDGPTGETRTRPGRRKGHPTTWRVSPYDEGEHSPMEEAS